MIKSIYEMFSEYSKEEVNYVINTLNEREKEIVYKRYNYDLNTPGKGKLTFEEQSAFYNKICPKIRRRLEKYRLYNNSVFNNQEVRDYVILNIYLGNVNNKKYTTKEISEFFNIDEKEILNIIRNNLNQINNTKRTKH